MSKEIIELLEKGVINRPIDNSVPVVWIKRESYEQALARLKQPKCKTCGDTKEIVRTFTGSIGLETIWRPKGSCNAREDEVKPCPDCQQSPTAGEFTKEIRTVLDNPQAIPARLRTITDYLLESCDRLDASEARYEDITGGMMKKEIELMQETVKLQSRLDRAEAINKDLLEACKRLRRRAETGKTITQGDVDVLDTVIAKAKKVGE